MGKKKQATAVSKSAAKKAKAVQKVERKEKKKVSKKNEDDDEDLEGILDKVSLNLTELTVLSSG